MLTRSSRRTTVVLAFIFLLSAAAFGKQLDISYTVSLTDPAKQQFHVLTEIKNIDQPSLDLALPTWTPGWYVVENYAKNVLRFEVRDAAGKWVQPRMVRKQTWRIDTRGINSIRVEYDYSATVLGLNQARIGDDFAFFTGMQLFLEPIGHRTTPSKLTFKLPQSWRFETPLKSTADPLTFIADDYDTLVDAPAMMGKYDLHEFTAAGVPHKFTAYPAGTFSKEKADEFMKLLASAIQKQAAIFGGLPFDKYLLIYFFQPAESNASGALEHNNSFVAFAPAGASSTPRQIVGTAAHEYFHVWNVKRVRPAEMWPYDYSRENESPSLWFSEGFTNYYSALSLYRAGVTDQATFLRQVSDAAAGIENSEARKYIPPASSSVITWVGYDTPQAFSISYYTQGQNLGALLDLSIRADTKGSAGLDDVFRALYNENYKKGKGFTTEELIAVIEKITKKDYDAFFNRHIFGVEVPDYDRIFGYAGLTLERADIETPDLGFSARPRDGGLMILGLEKGGSAEAAGIRRGDVITMVDGVNVFTAGQRSFAGKEVKVTVIRDGSPVELPFRAKMRSFNSFSLKEAPNATAEQIAVRNSWLKK